GVAPDPAPAQASGERRSRDEPDPHRPPGEAGAGGPRRPRVLDPPGVAREREVPAPARPQEGDRPAAVPEREAQRPQRLLLAPPREADAVRDAADGVEGVYERIAARAHVEGVDPPPAGARRARHRVAGHHPAALRPVGNPPREKPAAVERVRAPDVAAQGPLRHVLDEREPRARGPG